MEYAEEGNLNGYIKNKLETEWTEDHIIELFSKICEGVKYLHD